MAFKFNFICCVQINKKNERSMWFGLNLTALQSLWCLVFKYKMLRFIEFHALDPMYFLLGNQKFES